MRRKQGISLIILCVAVVILAILTTVTIVNFESITPSAKKEKIAEEFKEIEKKTKEYYLIYGNNPVKANTTYTKDEFIELANNDRKALLSDEIIQNGDADSIFYVVDLEKIGIIKTNMGNNEEPNDIYIASGKTGRIYYPKGIYVDGSIVFSTGAFDDIKYVE